MTTIKHLVLQEHSFFYLITCFHPAWSSADVLYRRTAQGIANNQHVTFAFIGEGVLHLQERPQNVPLALPNLLKKLQFDSDNVKILVCRSALTRWFGTIWPQEILNFQVTSVADIFLHLRASKKVFQF